MIWATSGVRVQEEWCSAALGPSCLPKHRFCCLWAESAAAGYNEFVHIVILAGFSAIPCIIRQKPWLLAAILVPSEAYPAASCSQGALILPVAPDLLFS